MMKNVLIIVCAAIFLSGCGGHKTREAKPNVTHVDLRVDSLDIELVNLNPRSFSGNGFFRVSDSAIFFFDVIFNTVTTFDKKGNYLETRLGKGDGPNEIPMPFVWHNFVPGGVGGRSIFLGRSGDLHYFDRDFARLNDHAFAWRNKKQFYKSYNALDIGMYGMDIVLTAFDANWLAMDSDQNIFIPLRILDSNSPKFNYFTKTYYEESFTVGVIDGETGNVEKGFGQWPSEYLHKMLPKYDNKYIGIKHDTIYVSYNASPDIQVYSPYPELKMLRVFGKEGVDIDTNYPNIVSREGLRKYRSDQGYYSHIYCDEDSYLTFRSYVKGKDHESSGIQIYQGITLIGDVVTPKRFNVIGKIGDYYYADGLLDEENNELKLFKFKINL